MACDQIAAELLMPFEQLRKCDLHALSVDTLIALSHKFGVSIQAMAMRISKLKIPKPSIGFCRWEHGSAQELWYVGKRLWLTPRPHFVAFERAMESAATVRMKDDWDSQGQTYPVLMEVRRLGKDFLIGLFWG
jgi:hypothetical protein